MTMVEMALLRDITQWAYAGAPGEERPDMHRHASAELPDILSYRVGGARGFFTTAAFGNIGDHVADDPDKVAARRTHLAERIRISNSYRTVIHWLTQIHSNMCHEPLSEPTQQLTTAPEGDALIIPAQPIEPAGVINAPAIMTADCIPVLCATEDGSWVGAAHAGRAGIMSEVIPTMVRALKKRASEQRIHAIIGPHIAADCYEISREMADEIATHDPSLITSTSWGTVAFDLTGQAARQLASCSITRIDLLEVCTRCHRGFFSHRRACEQGWKTTGRQASLVIGRS